MTAISKPLSSPTKTNHVRPFDAQRDLKAVADLVELCFADSLDDDGKRYLRRMRSAAKNSGLLRWVSFAAEWASVPLTGYVWQEDDLLVGNANLIPYHVRGRRYYLIANVAVHPDYRRRGIARSLTEHAVQHARQRGSPGVWLHVRQENQSALDLYRKLGFTERARRTSWLSDSEVSKIDPPKGTKLASPKSRDWDLQRNWLVRNYPPEVSWHMPLKVEALRPGFLGAVMRLLHSVFIQEVALVRRNELLGMVAWQPTSTYASALWMATPEDVEEGVMSALLSHARQRVNAHYRLTLDFPARVGEKEILEAGFSAQQTLIWMSLSFA